MKQNDIHHDLKYCNVCEKYIKHAHFPRGGFWVCPKCKTHINEEEELS